MRTLFALGTILGLTGLAAVAGYQARRAYEASGGGTTVFTPTPTPTSTPVETGVAATLLALLVKLAKGGVTGPIAKPAVLADRAQAAALLTGFGLTKSAAAVLAGVALPSGLPADERWPKTTISVRDRLAAALAVA